MTHMPRLVGVCGVLIGLGAALAGCGSDSSGGASQASSPTAAGATGMPSAEASAAQPESPPASAADAGAGATDDPSTVAPAGDACLLLTDDQAAAVMGYAAEGQALSAPGEAYSLSACTWGGPDKGVFMSLQLLTPGAVEDPLSLLLGASGETPTPYPALPDGEVWALGFLPGGGGQGQTITWLDRDTQVALSLLGDPISAEQQAGLEVAAGQVDAALGG